MTELGVALQALAAVIVIGSLIWVRFAFGVFNRDLRDLLRRQSEAILALEVIMDTITKLEKRVKALEDAR